jgi:flagellar FliL protein
MSAAAAAAPAAEAPPAKGKKKLIIIIAAVAVLLLAGGGGAFFMMKKKAADEAAAAEDGEGSAQVEKKPKKEHKKEDKHAVPVFVPLDPFVVNLADRDVDRFAQVGITLETEDAHAGDTIKAYLPAIRNNILLLLSRKTSQDLAGAEGKERLAKQVLRASVLPMGIELEDDEAPPEETPDVPVKKGKAKSQSKHFDSIDDSPIKSVQFSSFIIQ